MRKLGLFKNSFHIAEKAANAEVNNKAKMGMKAEENFQFMENLGNVIQL